MVDSRLLIWASRVPCCTALLSDVSPSISVNAISIMLRSIAELNSTQVSADALPPPHPATIRPQPMANNTFHFFIKLPLVEDNVTNFGMEITNAITKSVTRLKLPHAHSQWSEKVSKNLREELGLSQEKIGVVIGIDESSNLATGFLKGICSRRAITTCNRGECP